jgi:phosphoglycolate phosphatase-like HAD superfamily hydrolase
MLIGKEIETIFWDFDGVIKDSVEVKSDAFEDLFSPFGLNFSKKVRKHHENNTGLPRYDKLPLYIEWSGQKVSVELTDKYLNKFSNLVKKKVICSEWVPGVLSFLESNWQKKTFFLVTATPQSEIEEIISELDIQHYFLEVIGAPTRKSDAIKSLLKKYLLSENNVVFIGDSASDYNAAMLNNILFILRQTELNEELQKELNCPMISNFVNL